MSEHDDFRPTASWKNLRLRADMLRRLREFFDQRDFLEVETPILSADTVVDRHLDPFYTEVPTGEGKPSRRLWLQTSPEFCMKRLLAVGSGAIYQVTRAFRQGEQGPLHNPEFTMVEWYRPGDGMDEGMQRTSDLCEVLLQRGPAERIGYGEAFAQHVGLDPHTAEIRRLISAAEESGIVAPESLAAEDRDGWLDLLLTERVQPHLGQQRPAILYDYPAGQAALARIRGGKKGTGPICAKHPSGRPGKLDLSPFSRVAERFELYISGIELANGYHELLDPAELPNRIRRANAQRQADGKPTLPEQSRLLAAMESGLPSAVGVALGFDRLVMVAAGAKSIRDVMAFPFDLA